MTQHNVVRIEAPGLSAAQMAEGVSLGLWQPAEYSPAPPPVDWVIDLEPTYDGQVAAALAFIQNPPDLTEIDAGIKKLSDAYLTIRACHDRIPEPPSTGPDPWEKLRADYLARLHAAYEALVAAGGPV